MQEAFKPGRFGEYGDLETASEKYVVKPRHDLFALLPNDNFGSIIEFGCADGTNLLFFGSKLRVESRHLVGVDICRSAKSSYGGFQFHHRSVEHFLSTNNQLFDLVILSDVLEHLYNPWAVLKLINQIMHGSSRLLLSVPNLENLRYVDSVMSGAFDYGETGLFDQTHIRFFSTATLLKALEQNGFQISATGFRPDSGLSTLRINVESKLINEARMSLDMGNGIVFIDKDNIDRKFGQQILVCAGKHPDE